MAFAAEAERDLRTSIEKDGKQPDASCASHLYREGQGARAPGTRRESARRVKFPRTRRFESSWPSGVAGRPDQARVLYEAALKVQDEPIAKNNLA
jgi:hypothetical protein